MLNFLLLLNLYFCAFSNTCLKAVFSIYKENEFEAGKTL